MMKVADALMTPATQETATKPAAYLLHHADMMQAHDENVSVLAHLPILTVHTIAQLMSTKIRASATIDRHATTAVVSHAALPAPHLLKHTEVGGTALLTDTTEVTAADLRRHSLTTGMRQKTATDASADGVCERK